ncbi:MAG: hypothetical protein HY331_12710 [Chloroflexi bacterium]|nr:hypothetical protein [Chloroflexota bacterium]
MVRRILFSLIGVGLLTALLVAGTTVAQKPVPQVAPTPFANRSLIGASPAEVGEYALADVRANMRIVSGEPKVVLVRPVRAADLPGLGLGNVYFAGPEPPLMLVIVRGDIDVRNYFPSFTNMDPNTWHWRVGYIAFIMDLRAGMPSGVRTSVTGGRFRTALNDPTLPDEPPPLIATPRPVTPNPRILPMPTPNLGPLPTPTPSPR